MYKVAFYIKVFIAIIVGAAILALAVIGIWIGVGRLRVLLHSQGATTESLKAVVDANGGEISDYCVDPDGNVFLACYQGEFYVSVFTEDGYVWVNDTSVPNGGHHVCPQSDDDSQWVIVDSDGGLYGSGVIPKRMYDTIVSALTTNAQEMQIRGRLKQQIEAANPEVPSIEDLDWSTYE